MKHFDSQMHRRFLHIFSFVPSLSVYVLSLCRLLTFCIWNYFVVAFAGLRSLIRSFNVCNVYSNSNRMNPVDSPLRRRPLNSVETESESTPQKTLYVYACTYVCYA